MLEPFRRCARNRRFPVDIADMPHGINHISAALPRSPMESFRVHYKIAAYLTDINAPPKFLFTIMLTLFRRKYNHTQASKLLGLHHKLADIKIITQRAPLIQPRSYRRRDGHILELFEAINTSWRHGEKRRRSDAHCLDLLMKCDAGAPTFMPISLHAQAFRNQPMMHGPANTLMMLIS